MVEQRESTAYEGDDAPYSSSSNNCSHRPHHRHRQAYHLQNIECKLLPPTQTLCRSLLLIANRAAKFLLVAAANSG